MIINNNEEVERIAKEIVGKWGYEEEYWWNPIAKALTAYADQRVREESKKTLQELLDEVEGKKRKCNSDNWMINAADDQYNQALDTIATIIRRKMEDNE